MKILIIEDQKDLSDSICSYFANEQFKTETVFDYHSALEKISLYDYVCIVLDITLPYGSGLDILKELKANNKADGVIIISAKNALDDDTSKRQIKYSVNLKGSLPAVAKVFTQPSYISENFALADLINTADCLTGDVVVFDRGIQMRSAFDRFSRDGKGFIEGARRL